jgi:hypothetical protein
LSEKKPRNGGNATYSAESIEKILSILREKKVYKFKVEGLEVEFASDWEVAPPVSKREEREATVAESPIEDEETLYHST